MKKQIKFLAYLSSSLTLLSLLLMPAFSYAYVTPQPSLTLKTSASSVNVGTIFTITVNVNSGPVEINKVAFGLSYPSSSLMLEYGNGAGSPFTFKPGDSSHDFYSVSTKGISGTNLLYTAHVKALAAGKVSLSIPTNSFVVRASDNKQLPTGLNNTTVTITTPPSTAQLQAIIAKGDAAIALRLTDLNAELAKMAQVVTLSANDKTTLDNQINGELSGLAALKVKLDSETTVSAANAAYYDIFSDFRVFLLILPKVALIETADKELVVSAQLAQIDAKLQPLVTAAVNSGSAAGKIAAVALANFEKDYKQAQATAASMEVNVLPLQPADYDKNPKILTGDNAQLISANNENNSAYVQANAVVTDLGL